MKNSTKIAATLCACALGLTVPAVALANEYIPADEAVILSFPDGHGGYETAYDIAAEMAQNATTVGAATAASAAVPQVTFDTPVVDTAYVAPDPSDSYVATVATNGDAVAISETVVEDGVPVTTTVVDDGISTAITTTTSETATDTSASTDATSADAEAAAKQATGETVSAAADSMPYTGIAA